MATEEVEIKTNRQERELLSYVELSDKESKDFDYVNEEEYGSPRFFRYKGSVYDTSDCERVESTHPAFRGWDGYFSETFFSGVIFKYATDFETVIVGRYCT